MWIALLSAFIVYLLWHIGSFFTKSKTGPQEDITNPKPTKIEEFVFYDKPIKRKIQRNIVENTNKAKWDREENERIHTLIHSRTLFSKKYQWIRRQ